MKRITTTPTVEIEIKILKQQNETSRPNNKKTYEDLLSPRLLRATEFNTTTHGITKHIHLHIRMYF